MSNWDSIANTVEFNLEICESDLLRTIPTESKILDFGCGYGRISKQLRSLGYLNTVGIDSSREMIGRGLREFPYLDLRVSTSTHLPFPDSEFDAILTCAVITCIDNTQERKRVFNELNRVLKPQGVIYMAEFSSLGSIRFNSEQGVSMWHSSHEELVYLATSMTVLVSKQSKAVTMSGHNSHASHIFARKAT